MARPTKYKPEYDEMLIEHMSKGLSYECFGAVVDVHIDTLYEWEKVNPSFSEAKRKAFMKNRFFWEYIGIQHITHVDSKFESSPKLNSTVYIFNMKNRFPKEWRDRTEVRSEVKINSEALEAMDDNELTALVEKAVKQLKEK
jgi:hypothetical protein